MERRSREEFLRDPIGGFVQGSSFIVWAQSARRIGATHRRPLDLQDQSLGAALFGLPMDQRLIAPFDILHDLSDVDAVNPSVFGFAEAFIKQYIGVLAQRTRRVAVVRPDGLAGAALTGMFHDWVAGRLDAKLVATRREAYAFLGVSADDRAELDELHASFIQPEAMRRLQTALADDLQRATLERIAMAVGVSTRSLQRRIAECGTTFSGELAKARVRAAEALLARPDVKIEVIAREVGFRSAPAFTAAFRRITGTSPSTYREAHT